MAFHGHTKIELHNVKTGEDKVIEKHNIFTNYINDIMQVVPIPKMTNWMSCAKSSNRYGATQWNNQNNANNGYPRPIDILCGGILCLENEHEESADNYFLTTDDIITARGANIASASEDVTLGSYNATLEQSSDTSKTMVWDFAQNQGNGRISTIGLTNIGMGLCGLGGFPSNMTHTEANPFGDITLAKDFVTYINGYYDDDFPTTDNCTVYPLYFSCENNKLISFAGFTQNTKIFELRYYDLNSNIINPMLPNGAYHLSSTSISKYCGVDNSSGRISRYTKTNRVQFDISAYTFTGYSYLNMTIENGILYFAFHNNYQWTAGATITFVKIDLMKQEIIGTCPITNTTGKVLYLNQFSNYGKTSGVSGTPCTARTQIVNGYMILKTYDGKQAFAINIENSTDVKEILTPDGNSVVIDRPIIDFADGILYTGSNYSDNKIPSYYINPVKGTAKIVRTGSTWNETWFNQNLASNGYSAVFKLPSDSKLINFWLCCISGDYQKNSSWFIFMSYKQDVLSTINALDEPVVKTADMTMRITYTISLEE